MQFFSLLSAAFTRWREDKVPQLAASTAYYTIFSLAPLVIVLIAILGFFFDEASARAIVLDQLSGLVGQKGAEGIGSMVDTARMSTSSVLAALTGIAMLLLGATGVTMALQDSVNFIWKVKAKKTANSMGIIAIKRLFSLGFILGIGFLLLVSLVVSAALTAFATYLERFDVLAIILPLSNGVLSVVVIWVLFAALFKFMPDVRLTWKDVLPGSALSALLFVLGKSLLGSYLGQKEAVSAYGAAGSLIIVLLWINYSSQIFLFGIEYTKVYTLSREKAVVPKPYAELTEEPVSVRLGVNRLTILFAQMRTVRFMLKLRGWGRRKKS